MSRNVESHFALNPTNIDIGRSTFDRNASLKTSFNVGELIPIYCEEVLPGDSVSIKTSKVVRLQTLITPLMDNLYLDTYYFFVPNRLVWSHWQNLMGENTSSAWVPQVSYQVPVLEAPATTGWNVGTLADYFGIPTGIPDIEVNAMPFRAYALIVNDWFRDENLQQPLNIPVDDTTVTGVNTGTFVTDVAKGGLPFVASKYHDYFTSCLPGPQKSLNPVSINLTGDVPVFGNGYVLGLTNGTVQGGFTGGNNPSLSVDLFGQPVGTNASNFTNSHVGQGVFEKSDLTESTYPYTGLIADLGLASSISINSLRIAFQLQKLYEKDARGGSRYIEILKSHFAVTSPDARLQRPEYLGGNRLPLNINQVVQTSDTSNTPQGNVAGYSVTTDRHEDFFHSFVEHGFVIGLACVRYQHTYQQGLRRFWSRRGRFDYYWPVLANIGEQPVLNKEIFCDGSSDDDDVFGYQEAWADYRYTPNIVTGEMRSAYSASLDSWHLADDYSSLPSLSDSWIQEDKSNLDRALAVQSSVSNQIFGDFYFEASWTRPMPLYSIPGLIDHH